MSQQTILDIDAFEHIRDSSADPWFLSEQYNISKLAVDMIQAGRLRANQVVGLDTYQSYAQACQVLQDGRAKLHQELQAASVRTGLSPRQLLQELQAELDELSPKPLAR